MALDVTFAGTLRKAQRHGIDTSTAPLGATHVSLWTLGEGQQCATVWERAAWGRTRIWEGGAWVNTEAHYAARRLLATTTTGGTE